MDQLSLLKSSGGLGLPHQEGACLSLPLCTQKMNRSNVFCTDHSACFVSGGTKNYAHLRNQSSRELTAGDRAKLSARAASYLPSCTSAIVGWFPIVCAHCLTRFLRSTHLLRQDERALFLSQFAVDVPLGRRDRVCRERAAETAKTTSKGDRHCLFWCRRETDLLL